ncbi:MAG: hypothetical protein QXF25_01025 [Candidatus Pacearchaeota archaeon]
MKKTSEEKERKNNKEENKKNSKQIKEDNLKKILLEKLKEIKAKEDKKIEEKENEIAIESEKETEEIEEIAETGPPIVKTPLLISTKSRERLEERLEISEEKEEKPKKLGEERKYTEFRPAYESVKGITREEAERRYDESPISIERKEELEKPQVPPFRREKQIEGELTKKDIREEYRIEEEKRQEDLYKKKNLEMR